MSDEVYAYYRVSTGRQGLSGLGLDAQRAVTQKFVETGGRKLLGEFTEVESGRKSNRPQLHAAIAACKRNGATLLIAKLDRLARNVYFISGLLESGVRFVAVDMPNADRFMLHVYAAMAEEEGRRISERTKAALAAAKRRGVELGTNGKTLAAKNRREADDFAESVAPVLRNLILVEKLPFRAVADRMNDLGCATARGGVWHPTTVYRAWTRIMAANAS